MNTTCWLPTLPTCAIRVTFPYHASVKLKESTDTFILPFELDNSLQAISYRARRWVLNKQECEETNSEWSWTRIDLNRLVEDSLKLRLDKSETMTKLQLVSREFHKCLSYFQLTTVSKNKFSRTQQNSELTCSNLWLDEEFFLRKQFFFGILIMFYN